VAIDAILYNVWTDLRTHFTEIIMLRIMAGHTTLGIYFFLTSFIFMYVVSGGTGHLAVQETFAASE
jgi:hypothetical protein